MKITIESTTKIVEVVNGNDFGRSESVPCRVWEGVTDSGIKVQCLVTRIAAEKTEDLSQFEKELKECRVPSPDIQAFPLRMIL